MGWFVFKDPNWAIGSGSASAIIGGISTARSIFINYKRESKLAWTIGFFGGLFTFLSIGHSNWDFAHLAQPLSYWVIDVIICALLFALPYFKKSKNQK